MIGLGFSFAILIAYVPSPTDKTLLFHTDYPGLLLGVSIVVTSFGYHIIIPSLTTYMEHNVKMLRWTILIGSIIPLLIYIAWQYSVLHVLNLEQIRGAWDAGEPATLALAELFHRPILATIAKSLTFFAIITSFLGVSLSLSDFLIDGFNIKKGWEGRLLAIGLTFIPPLIFVYTYKRGFYLALQYGGAFVTILLIVIPVLMAWRLPGKFYRSPSRQRDHEPRAPHRPRPDHRQHCRNPRRTRAPPRALPQGLNFSIGKIKKIARLCSLFNHKGAKKCAHPNWL